MEAKDKRLNLRLTKSEYEKLEKLAEKYDKSPAEIARLIIVQGAIDEDLTRFRKEMLRQIWGISAILLNEQDKETIAEIKQIVEEKTNNFFK